MERGTVEWEYWTVLCVLRIVLLLVLLFKLSTRKTKKYISEAKVLVIKHVFSKILRYISPPSLAYTSGCTSTRII